MKTKTLSPNEGTFDAVVWIHSNADTHELDSIDLCSITGKEIPFPIIEELLGHKTPYQLFLSGWDDAIDWDNIELDTTYRIYVEWTFEPGDGFSFYCSTLERIVDEQ